jgi:hypothetical protein
MKHGDLNSGETYRGVVDRISGSGNGIVELSDTHINLGPINRDAVGEEIEFKYMRGNMGKCLNEEYIHSDYIKKLKKVQKGTSTSNKNISRPDNKNKLLNGKL